jgi:hypothetical protein
MNGTPSEIRQLMSWGEEGSTTHRKMTDFGWVVGFCGCPLMPKCEGMNGAPGTRQLDLGKFYWHRCANPNPYKFLGYAYHVLFSCVVYGGPYWLVGFT